MPVTLAEAKNNTTDDVDLMVIDEFRKESVILDLLTFDDCVNPNGGGGTLTYGYRRQITQATADTRAINSEYTPQNVTTERYTTDLAVLGGSFEVDRVVAGLGPAASGAVALNMANKVQAASTKFQDLVINGDTAADENGFDGLNVALSGSTTEKGVGTSAIDWSDFDSGTRPEHKALDKIDEFLAVLDGAPTVILGNAKTLARVRAAARRAGMYTKDPVEGLLGQNGRPITREAYGNIPFADPGAKAGSNDPIIAVMTRSTKWQITETGTGGTFQVVVDGLATGDLAYNVANADLKAALEALPGVGTVTVTGTPGTSAALTFSEARNVTLIIATTGGNHTIAENSGTKLENVTDLYAVRFALDGFKGLSTVGGQLVHQWMPDFSSAKAVKTGEVELGPVGCALMKTKAAAVLRNIKVS